MTRLPRIHQFVVAGVFAMLGGGCSASAQTPPPAVWVALDSATTRPVAREASTARPVAARDLSAAPEAAATTQPIVVSAVLEQSPTTRPIPASATQAPVLTPPTLLQEFDAELDRVIHDRPPVNSFITAPSEEGTLVKSVLAAISDFRVALRDESGLLADKSAPILKLSEQIREQIPLTLPVVALCRSVQQFGVYEPIESPRLAAGTATPVVIYCEVDHFRSRLAPSDGQWETKLSYEAVLYTDSNPPRAVLSKKPANLIDRCRDHRRDFFLADRMTIPADLPAGQYVLKVTVIDQLGNHVAEKTVPVVIAAH